jgi:uncharacterized protein (TIGR03790 family)
MRAIPDFLRGINISGHTALSRAADFNSIAAGFVATALFLILAQAASAGGLSDRVILLANSEAPGSVAIAEHYAQVRGVPPGNIISLKMPVAETITWKEFVSTVWQPLEDQLVRKGWIDAIAMDLFDDVGRRKYAVSGHRIEVLVVCRGVPLRIEHDPLLFKEVEPLTQHPQLRTNQGAVDSELSLLAQTNYPINAMIPNPLYHNDVPTDIVRQQVVKVSRLDGPTVDEALHLVDLAVAAEHTGLLGRAYVDIAGPTESGNAWLATAASAIRGLGYDLSVSHGPGTIPNVSRFDAPAFYLGWYAPDINGPFRLPGFRFPPGAIAVHMHSFSARTLRSDTEGWCGPFVAMGATATMGNVFEPYLEYVHHPDLLMAALSRGDDLVDAAYYALPVLSWQSILIGDPLYRPLAVPLSAQTGNLSALPPQLAPYAAIREMNLMDAEGRKDEAIKFGRSALKEAPGLALALALAQRLEASGAGEAATWVVRGAGETADTSASNWGLISEAASFLAAQKKAAEAIDLYRRLFAVDTIPASARASWLAEARRVALQGGDTGQAAEWNEELDQALKKSGVGQP